MGRIFRNMGERLLPVVLAGVASACTPKEKPEPPICAEATILRARQDLIAQQYQAGCPDICDVVSSACSGLSQKAQELGTQAFNAEKECRDEGGKPQI